MIPIVIGCFFCFVAFAALFAKSPRPGGARHGGEAFGLFAFELGFGVALIVFGIRFLALRRQVVEAAGRHLKDRGSIDVAGIARETGTPDTRVRQGDLQHRRSHEVPE